MGLAFDLYQIFFFFMLRSKLGTKTSNTLMMDELLKRWVCPLIAAVIDYPLPLPVFFIAAVYTLMADSLLSNWVFLLFVSFHLSVFIYFEN